jgi:DNA end-binding protein Ku
MASTIWKGHLTFGLVSIPIKLTRAARAEKVHMHNIQRKSGARVRQVFVRADEPIPLAEEPTPFQPPARQAGPSLVAAKSQVVPFPSGESDGSEPSSPAAPQGISRSDLVRGYEYEKGKYVAFEADELEKLAPKSSENMEIFQFVRFEEVDPVYLESSYYVAPDNGGEKPYALLYEALKKTGYAAIAEFVMHRRDQTMILRHGRDGIIAHTLFYEDEVRRENEFHADPGQVQPKEMELAVKLVDALAAKFEPDKFKDKYREKLKDAISQKIEAGEVREAPAEAPQSRPSVDIMAALTESLAKAKKPVVSEGKPVAVPALEKKKGGRKTRG